MLNQKKNERTVGILMAYLGFVLVSVGFKIDFCEMWGIAGQVFAIPSIFIGVYSLIMAGVYIERSYNREE